MTQAVFVLPHEAKWTLLQLFCLQLNVFKLQLKSITVHIFFFRPQKQRNYTSYNHFMRQNMHS